MSEKIDINTADAETLTTISGIGPALAERIIEYRQTVHPFEEVIELAAVPGISEKMVRAFEAHVTVEPAANTAVPPQLDDTEAPPLLDGPDEVVLLGAPEQPEALLAAEVPTTIPAVEAEPEIEEVVADSDDVDNGDAAEPEAIETETVPAADEVPDDAPATEETAVPLPNSPEIENLPLSDPGGAAMPDPDMVAAMSARQNAAWETKAQRRGCLNTLLGATFGAILGAVLTLAILAALNQGSLTYSADDAQLRQQLDTEIISRTTELNQLSTRVSLAATTEAGANEALQSDLAAADEVLSEGLADSEEMISYLATRSGDLDQRIQEVAGAADTFTSFLDGLRSLLNDLEEGTATPTPAPFEETVSPTPSPTFTPTPFGTSSLQPSATTEAEATPTAVPTRTPQPTSTPFTFPTNTPAPQP